MSHNSFLVFLSRNCVDWKCEIIDVMCCEHEMINDEGCCLKMQNLVKMKEIVHQLEYQASQGSSCYRTPKRKKLKRFMDGGKKDSGCLKKILEQLMMNPALLGRYFLIYGLKEAHQLRLIKRQELFLGLVFSA